MHVIDSRMLKRFLLLFWAIWLTIVVITNGLDGLKELGVLGEGWRFASGNYKAIGDTTGRYQFPNWVNALLFAGVVFWEGLAALLFWRAWQGACGREPSLSHALYPAFVVSLALFGAFILVDEVFIAYAFEGTHMRIFIAQLVTLLVLVRLPDSTMHVHRDH